MKKLMALVLALVFCLAGAAAAEDGPSVYGLGDTLEDFTVTTWDGRTVTLSALLREKQMVLINFWATWCGPCQSEMPAFDDAWKEYGDRVAFMMVDLTDGSRDTVDSAKAFIADKGYSFPVYFDTEYSGARTYGVSSIPATVLVDGDGYVVSTHVGAMSADSLMSMLALVLGD